MNLNGKETEKKTSRIWVVNIFLVLIILIVIAISWWLGSLAGRYSLRNLLGSSDTSPQSTLINKDLYEDNVNLPLYFFVGANPCEEVASHELKLSVDAGIRNFICKVDFPWFGSNDLPKIFTVLQCLNEIAPWGRFFLYVDLNPPEQWFEGKKDVKIIAGGVESNFASFCSGQWIKSVEEGFYILAESIKNSKMSERIGGIVIGYLKNGMWILPGLDLSPPAIKEFAKWSENKFTSSEEKWNALGTDNATFENLNELLVNAIQSPSKGIFEDNRILIFYREFINEKLGNTAGHYASLLKNLFNNKNLKVMIPYGFTLESGDADTGHSGFTNVLNSEVDTIILPVSYISRGAGDTGAPSGLIESIIIHNKEALILDDTRTGVTYDLQTDSPSRIKGIKEESVLAVHKRNSGMAIAHNAGVIWHDPEGKGWLSANEEWENIKKIIEVFKKQMSSGKISFLSRRHTKEHSYGADNDKEGYAPRLQLGKVNTPELETQVSLSLLEESMLFEQLALIVDERVAHRLSSRGSELYTKMLVETRDHLLRVGLPVEFYIFQDLIEERIPPKTIYFIFSIASPTQKEIDILHHIFEADKAIVFWFYIPGWDVILEDEKKIKDLTQIQCKLYTSPSPAGSYFDLEGRWVNKGENIGEEEEHFPLIYIDDPDADALAKYRKDGKCSIAVKTVNEKWVSVLYAEPTINFLILREILSILEVPTLVGEGSVEAGDTFYIGSNILVIHTKGIGDRIIQFNQFVNLENLFQPEQKWFERETILLSLGNGETILLGYKPR
ncbi:MAG: hypothetical protein N3G21_13580 [Candidatus Hydrogenedentes bacterium]|nr:hypothetical protein [Candidatus Hydrogenedentota bacterium]